MNLFTLGLLQKNLSGNKGDIKSKNGESSYTITDAVDFPVLGLNLYGKSVQDGVPTPDAPVDIVSVGDSGSVAVTACGKNLYQGTKVSPKSSGGWYCILGGVDVTTLAIEDYKIPYGEELTLSLKYEGDLYTSIKYKKDGNFTNLAFEVRSKQITFTIPEDYDELFIFSRNGTSNSFEINDIQIELGDTATSYEPYKSTTATITSALPLCGIPVDSGGNYTDSNGQQWICDELIYNADGTGKIIKRINEIIFNGGEDWKLSGNGKSAFLILSDDIKVKFKSNLDNAEMFSNKYVAGSYNDYYNTTKTCISTAENGAIVLYDERFVYNVEALKADMVSNNLRVVYALATPKEIELTAAEMTALRQLMTYSGTTNISNSDNAEMDVKYCINQVMADYYPIFAGQGADVQPLVLFEGTDEGYTLADGFTGFSEYSQGGADIAITKRIDTTNESQYGYRIAKSWSIDDKNANYTDSVIISSNELVDLTNYNTVCIDFYGYCDYETFDMSDANDMAAYFRVDLPKTLPQSKVAYDWSGWDNMGMNYHKRGKYYFDVSHLTGKHDLCFGIFHGTYDMGYTNGIKIYKMTLI